ncbi:MAG: acyl-CoA dehydrogenase family protein [Bradymonadaceae bacterium]
MGFYDNFIDERHELVRQTAREFAEDEIAPHVVEWEEAGQFPRDLYHEAAEAGLLGVGFSEEIGGAGGGAMDEVMVIEGLMYGGSTGVMAGLGSLGIALPPLVQAGDDHLIENFARPALAGDKIAALAITEPGAGSDVTGVRTRADRDGDEYVVHGSKIFITSGVRADFLTALVRTGEDRHEGLTFLVIETDREGVRVSKALKKTGWCASDTAELAFDGVRVPVDNRVGSEGDGFQTLMRNFQNERLALAAYGAAASEVALEETERYVQEREVFDRSVSDFQVTQHKLADMATQVTAAKTLVYQLASRMEAGEYLVEEVSMAKNFCAEVAHEVTYEAVQLHGGMGYMRETMVERLSRDARLLPIGGGTQEIMKEIIAKQRDY